MEVIAQFQFSKGSAMQGVPLKESQIGVEIANEYKAAGNSVGTENERELRNPIRCFHFF